MVDFIQAPHPDLKNNLHFHPEQAGELLAKKAQLLQVLFTAAAKEMYLPNVDVLMSCDLGVVTAALTEDDGKAKYFPTEVFYALGSTPEKGEIFARSTTDAMTARIKWEGGALEKVTVLSASIKILSYFTRYDLPEMMLLIDGSPFERGGTIRFFTTLLPEELPVKAE